MIRKTIELWWLRWPVCLRMNWGSLELDLLPLDCLHHHCIHTGKLLHAFDVSIFDEINLLVSKPAAWNDSSVQRDIKLLRFAMLYIATLCWMMLDRIHHCFYRRVCIGCSSWRSRCGHWLCENRICQHGWPATDGNLFQIPRLVPLSRASQSIRTEQGWKTQNWVSWRSS